MDYLVGCMSYIFFCVTNLLFEKYNGVGHQKFMVNLVMNFLTMYLVPEIYYLMKLVNRCLTEVSLCVE